MESLVLDLDLDHLLDKSDIETNSPQEESDLRSIAVIGIDAKLGEAESLDEIWQVFQEGKNMISELSANRISDIRIRTGDSADREIRFSRMAYLPRIDLFDPELFNISQTEAEYIDPAQRIYLESAWTAIEDAGYGGKRLYGTKTGVYIGYTSKSDWEILGNDIPEEALGLAVSGHTNSFMAGRLSYLLNLKGPSVIIDTACSSSLVALHEACRALRNKDITMAVVGSVHILVYPGDGKKQMGTSSSTGYTKSFDEKADGTGGGEGVINLVLKPLKEALTDNDHIYGIIKGSCVNQDGKSIGLTAPNSEAQAEVLLGAWRDAGVAPEEISYIEAHGTATKLGDPVEIGGITQAFSKLTTKKQFCAIGSAKSNFGHLDCAAGLLGVLKVLLMMRYRQIPPTIHFNTPNGKIDYINSPIYINDKVRSWRSESGSVTAGISSFGLSGTNCHVVIQSYALKKRHKGHSDTFLFTASAKNKTSLVQIIRSYQRHVKDLTADEVQDFCYTINTGRGQYENRFAGVFSSVSEFLCLNETELFSEKYYSDHQEQEPWKKEKNSELISTKKGQSNKVQQFPYLDKETELSELYLKNIDVNFESLYEDQIVYRVSAPTYAFNHKRCEPIQKNIKEGISSIAEKTLGPMVDRCAIESDQIWIFEKKVSLDSCMEIREHRIKNVHILPGTAYVEMAHTAARYIYGSDVFRFNEITFNNFLSCKKNEIRILHAIVEKEEERLKLRIVSRNEESSEWILHSEMMISRGYVNPSPKEVDIRLLLADYNRQNSVKKTSEKEQFVQLGEHWDCDKSWYLGKDSLVLCSQLRQGLENDSKRYYIYPVLLDGSVNASIILLESAYLPLLYKDACFYGEIKGRIYSQIIRLNPSPQNKEVEFFKIRLFNEYGSLLGEIKQYVLKKCNESELFVGDEVSDFVHQICWKPEERRNTVSHYEPETVIVFLSFDQQNNKIFLEIKKRFKKVMIIFAGTVSRMISSNEYEVGNSEAEQVELLKKIRISEGTMVINLLGYLENDGQIDETSFRGIQITFLLVKILTNFSARVKLVCIANNTGMVTAEEERTNSIGNSLLAFTISAGLELNTLKVCAIDTDDETRPELLFEEMSGVDRIIKMAYRKNIRYTEQVSRKYFCAKPIVPMRDDVIVIPGGYGGIGLAVSEYLCRRCSQLRIVLLSRSNIDETVSEKRYMRLQCLIQNGYQIAVRKADVTVRNEVAEVLKNIRIEYGHIDGIIYAAGIGEEGTLVSKTWSDEWEIIKTKALGVWNVDWETRDDNLKFFIMFSSLTSLLGAAGQTGYAAANAFLDSYVLCAVHKNCTTMTINWTGWKESGMAYHFGVDSSNSLLEFVSDEEGGILFGDALKTGLRRVAIVRFKNKLAIQDYNEIQKRIRFPKEYVINNETDKEEIQEIEIYGKSPENLTEEERKVAYAWCRTLKISSINIYSPFFEAGGNSLLASILQKEINAIYPSVVAITDIFIYPTIEKMAAYIADKNRTETKAVIDNDGKSENIEELVKQFAEGSLSMKDMEQFI